MFRTDCFRIWHVNVTFLPEICESYSIVAYLSVNTLYLWRKIYRNLRKIPKKKSFPENREEIRYVWQTIHNLNVHCFGFTRSCCYGMIRTEHVTGWKDK